MTRRRGNDTRILPVGSGATFLSHDRFLVLLFACCGLTLAVFLPAVWNGFVNYDDPVYVTANRHLQSGLSWKSMAWAMRSFYAANWHPVAWLSHLLDVQLYGFNPAGHHLTNVIIHTLNVALLGLILRKATRQTLLALATAALFGVHPIHVESVAWVAERKDVLNAFFSLASLLCYLFWVDRRKRETPSSSVWYAGSLMAFALSLSSKGMSVTLPFLMLLMDYWPLERFRTTRAFRICLLEKIPFVILAGLASLLTLFAQRVGGAVKDTILFPLSIRMENAVVALIRYVGKTLWPANLCVFYPYALPPFSIVLACSGLLVLISVATIWWWRRFPAFFFGWWWFCLGLMPVIGIIQIGTQSMADRYMYLPSIGVLVALVWGGADALASIRIGRIATAAITFVLIGAASFLTLHQIRFWKNSETLFSHALAVTDDNALAHFNLGIALSDDGDLERGISEMREALRLAPMHPDVHLNLGMMFDDMGQIENATKEFRNALELRPDYPEAHANLGKALEESGRLDAAVKEYREAVRLQPDFWDAHLNLGTALERAGDVDEAISEYREAVRQNERSALAHSNLALALSKVGRGEEGILEFRRALAIDPSRPDSALNLAVGLFRAGQADEAIKELERLVKLQPDYAQAYFNLGGMLLSKGLYERAIEAYRKCLSLDPNSPDAEQNMRTVEEQLASQSR